MPRDVLGQRTRGAALLVVLALVVLLTQFTTGFSQGPNNRNVSVDTRVNVTGSAPEILSVILDTSITLTAGSVKSIACNLTVRDYNGGSDVTHANATLFRANRST